MRDRIIMKYPSAWHGEMWRESAPCGNGLIGLGVYGGIKKEIIMVNHAYLWRGSRTQELPDISDRLPDIRKCLDENDPRSADSIMSSTLRERGYSGEFAVPLPLGDVNIFSHSNELYKNYRRVIDMDKAMVTVSWSEGEVNYTRESFVSRANNLIFVRISANEPVLEVNVGLAHHDDETIGDYKIADEQIETDGANLYYAAYNDGEYARGDYGIVARIMTDGAVEPVTRYAKQNALRESSVSGAMEIVIVARTFVSGKRAEEFKPLAGDYSFDEELSKHVALHNKLYSAVDFSISETSGRCNEELLLEAYDAGASNELIEKLYRYGRYLFICSTGDKDTLPCHLIGLWNGTYSCFWAFYMYNINYEMMYWQALSGNLPEFLRLALLYTESQVGDFEENAKKLYGCRGIYINSVNAPESGLSKCGANHILNWTCGAAWISQHYFDYYEYTGDVEFLKQHSLPFMYKAALFFEDFLYVGDDGYYCFAPSVSPENTARNVLDKYHQEIETCKNATMDIAIVKELLTNLIKGSEITGMYAEKRDTWRSMLEKLPPYRVNKDGAVKEWTDDFYEDNYNHRHHSHLYPVFPGREVKPDHPLFGAFKKAEDMRLLRGLSEQSSWSMVFMTGIAARMGDGDRALTILGTIARTCLMNNLFTLHNDWRRTGPVYCEDFRIAPFQMDGNLGIPAAINEMLISSDEGGISILPALPEAWKSGHITGILTHGGVICSVKWDENTVTVTLTCSHEATVNLFCSGKKATAHILPDKQCVISL